MAKDSAAASNQTAEKLLLVLEALARQTQPVKLVDLAHQVGMNQSTCYRFVAALQNAGYAAQDKESGKYILNLKLCSLAEMIKDRVSVTSLLHAFVAEASALFQESAHLVQEENRQIVYIDNVTISSQSLITRQYIGRTAPMYCTGVGKSILAFLSPREVERVWNATDIQVFTPATIVTLENLFQDLEGVRQRGFAYDNEEHEEGVRCIAAPIFNWEGTPTGAVSISAPTSRLTDETVERLAPQLLSVSNEISQLLGRKPG